MENEQPEETFVTGRIVKVSDKGYGFIISPDIKFTRIFFHWTALVQQTKKFTELEKGMKVRFVAKVKEGQGMRAIKISVINGDKNESPTEHEGEDIRNAEK